jgi:hypothetical protein
MQVVKEEQAKARQIAEPGDIVEWQGGTMEIVMVGIGTNGARRGNRR